MIAKLANENEYSYNWVGVAFDGNLYIGLKDMDLSRIITDFSNPSNTGTIVFYPDEENLDITIVKEGFSRFVSVRVDSINDEIIVGLGRRYAAVGGES